MFHFLNVYFLHVSKTLYNTVLNEMKMQTWIVSR